MEDLLTSKQVQDILKIERITVYRMLNDHRLKGIKIGKQWRFPASQFENLQSFEKHETEGNTNIALSQFPTHCMQTIQNLISDLRDIPTLIVDVNGNPLTEAKHYCSLCQAIQREDDGELGCLGSWKNVPQQNANAGWMYCHAGLAYFYQILQENEKTIAYLLAGQFRISNDTQKHLPYLSDLLEKSDGEVQVLIDEIPLLNQENQQMIEHWMSSAAIALEEIFIERADLLQRLKQIAEISQISA
jgi:excisionase family DNA binding protein